jgi:hypothetical protein
MQNTIPYPIDDEEEDDFIEEEDDEKEIDEDFYTDSIRTQYQEYGDII